LDVVDLGVLVFAYLLLTFLYLRLIQSLMSIPILMYHQIAALPPRTQPLWALTVAPGRFRSQMAWMHRLGYRGLSQRALLPYLRGEKTGKVFGITFDDGFDNVRVHAMPVLKEFGFTATCYFVAQRVGGYNDWDTHVGVPAAPLMDERSLRAWAQAGHEVGSHTLDHVHLPALTLDDAWSQIERSRHVLEDVSGLGVESFCYPYGEATPEVQGLVQRAGYTNATMTHRGRARASDDVYDLPRVSVAGFTGTLRFLQKCLSGHEDRRR
jgi:peptidoglycan/xylan/chitin deacetylase (PgdA/CDA1 family)